MDGWNKRARHGQSKPARRTAARRRIDRTRPTRSGFMSSGHACVYDDGAWSLRVCSESPGGAAERSPGRQQKRANEANAANVGVLERTTRKGSSKTKPILAGHRSRRKLRKR